MKLLGTDMANWMYSFLNTFSKQLLGYYLYLELGVIAAAIKFYISDFKGHTAVAKQLGRFH